MSYCLGKSEKRVDVRTLKLKRYLTPALPPPPPASDYTTGIKTWPMLKNDQLGDCVVAGFLHAIQLMTANSGDERVATDADAITVYEELGGYNPADPNTDQGCDMLSAMNLWRSQGIVGHKIDAYGEVNINDLDELKQAVHLFGAAPIGVMLPKTAEAETDAGKPWSSTIEQPDPTRGHCVVVVRYDGGYFYVVTWGDRDCTPGGILQAASPAWLLKYMDEAYAPLSQADWGVNSPVAVDIAALQIDLAASFRRTS